MGLVALIGPGRLDSARSPCLGLVALFRPDRLVSSTKRTHVGLTSKRREKSKTSIIRRLFPGEGTVQLVARRSEKAKRNIDRVRVPGTAKDFSPRVSFQRSLSYAVRTAPVCNRMICFSDMIILLLVLLGETDAGTTPASHIVKFTQSGLR